MDGDALAYGIVLEDNKWQVHLKMQECQTLTTTD